MFPDPIAQWHPYPSAIDGIERPPYVFDRGLWRGTLHLIVLSPKPHERHFGVEIRCDAYFGVEEMIYSVSDHGGRSLYYNGDVYIKETKSSSLLTAYRAVDPPHREPRHFAFVGADYCYEVLALAPPTIRSFASRNDAYSWAPGLPD